MKRSAAQPPAFHLHVQAEVAATHVPLLRRQLRRLQPMLDSAVVELSIAIVGDRAMDRLHRQYLGIAGSTDVLTFELDHDRAGRCTAGEIVLCAPEAKRRAAQAGTTAAGELLLYALHGWLHLSGWDDRTDRDYRRMHAMEDRLLVQLGVGPLFAAGATNVAASPKKRKPRHNRRPVSGAG